MSAPRSATTCRFPSADFSPPPEKKKTRSELTGFFCCEKIEDHRRAGLAGRALRLHAGMNEVVAFQHAAALQSLHAPVGIDIGAETPQEIAVSILAQLIAQRRR